MSNEKSNDDWKSITVTLPVRYWVTVLGVLDPFIQNKIVPQLQDLQKRGTSPDEIPDVAKAVLTGPLFARGEIVKVLHEAGVVTPEANAKVGTDALMTLAKKFQNRRN